MAPVDFPKSLNLDGEFKGRGTSLKPAHEPIVVARKPLIGTVAENCLAHGTGALNVDGCRIGTNDKLIAGGGMGRLVGDEREGAAAGMFNGEAPNTYEQNPSGRWPANVTLSHLPECEAVGTRKVKSGEAVRERSGGNTFGGENEKPPMENMTYGEDGTETVIAYNCAPGCPVAELDRQSGELPAGMAVRHNSGGNTFGGENEKPTMADMGYGDTGGASRFMYVAKASRSERTAGVGANAHPT